MRGLILAAALAGVAGFWPALVHADGEVGLVIQHGDGTTETYCIAFTGDGISGDRLFEAADIPVEQFSGLVCAVGTNPGEGCYDAGSFESCTCKCRGGVCEYWAFFTQTYGAGWVYSARGFTAQRARDGDLHAWKWGAGGPNSAPAPAATRFEQVCGHAPRGGLAATATLVPTSSVATQPPVTQRPSGEVTAPPGASTGGPTASSSSPTSASGAATLTVVVTMVITPASTAPLPPAKAGGDGGGGTSSVELLAFAAIALALLAAIGAAVWRRRHAR